MRHKEVYGINVHPSLKFALDFGMSLISEKIKSRIKIYTSLEDAINHKMDVSMLPKEYGGTIPMKEMIGNSCNFLIFAILSFSFPVLNPYDSFYYRFVAKRADRNEICIIE